MSVLRHLKLSLLATSRACGVFRLVRSSRWRARQLLILCYHGVSIDDEHEWAPGLYVTAEGLAERLATLRRLECNVLPLAEGVRRLYDGSLPPRSVVITFDDGNHDFYSRALPLLREYGMPATVYLTTYYCEVELPVFPLVVSYVLWKRRGGVFPFAIGDREVTLDTRSAAGRRAAQQLLLLHSQETGMSALEKDALAERLADALAVDYGEIRRKRIMHIMTPSEVHRVAEAGIDVQLHTHRHRSPPDRERYRREVIENRERIARMTGSIPRHFCYPSGVRLPQFEEWLDGEGILSATTCEPGMATPQSDRLGLPRLLDHSELTPVEFEAWIAGLGAVLPRRPVGFLPLDDDGRPAIRLDRQTLPAASRTNASPAHHEREQLETRT